MTQTEYQHWIEYVNENYLPFPANLLRDMSNWQHRSMLAKALVRAKQYAPAIELFQSIVDIKVNVEEDGGSLSEVEDKVWCLWELAISLWRTTGNRSEAAKYMEEAITLIETYPQPFNVLDKQEVLHEIQEFLLVTSTEKVVISEVE